MSYVEELESKILELPQQDFAKLRNWLIELDDAQWDKQIASDLKSGKLNHLINNAKTEMAAGTAAKL
jgi:hypothetical protein